VNCPECTQPLNAVKVDQVELGACRTCGGLWFSQAQFRKVAAEETVRAVADASHGKLGRCRGCHERLTASQSCPKCQRKVPACPDCGRAPLALGNVRGVNVDVCPGCSGVWFDPGELQLVAGFGPAVQRVQMGAFKSTVKTEPSRHQRVTCDTCKKRIARVHAFAKDDVVYCGTCCPKGAAPVVAILTAKPTTVSEECHHHHAMHGQTDPLSTALRVLLEFLG
jgi:Zn-finger nucleic acid-binding protein